MVFFRSSESLMLRPSRYFKIAMLFGMLAMVPIFACRQQQKADVVDGKKKAIADGSVGNRFKFQSAEFDQFYSKFISDSLFQLSRVSFPIDGGFADYEGEKNWHKESWLMMKWDLRSEMNNSNDSCFVEQNDSSVFWGSYCRDCGFSVEVKFQKKSGKWFLVYRQENNF